MKKLFSGLGVRVAALLASIATEVKASFKGSAFNAPKSNPQRRSGKSSGGKSKSSKSTDPVYRAWRKLFGGIAVPSYIFIDPGTPSLKYHRTSAPGARPYSFYKTSRA